MPIDIVVNGERRTIPPGQNILDLLRELQLEPARVAVELDRRIVKQPRWSETILEAGARWKSCNSSAGVKPWLSPAVEEYLMWAARPARSGS